MESPRRRLGKNLDRLPLPGGAAGTTAGGLCLTPGPREIVDSGASQELEFFQNPGLFSLFACGNPADHQGKDVATSLTERCVRLTGS